MNPMTGELRMFKGDDEIPEGFERIPALLRREAMLELEGKNAAHVDMNGPSKLVNWAKRKSENKRKAKIAAASRQKNRK